MNKENLIQEVAAATKTKKNAGAAVNAAIEAMKNALTRGERIIFAGFGTFTVKTTKARKARRPGTGAFVMIPAGKVVRFRPSAGLVDQVDAEAATAPQKKPWRFNDATARWRV
jgi:DNA-binding protein HU-beta